MNISVIVMFAASDVSFTKEIKVLKSAGMHAFIACGKTMKYIACHEVSPHAIAPSVWLLGTETIAPLMVSDAYAPTLSEKAMIADGNAGMLSPTPGKP